MKLLVTGGAGFIGSNFILHWLKQHPEDSVVNLDILSYAANLSNLAEVEDNSNYTFVKGDICDANVVDSLIKECDIVVHFAAESHVDRSIQNAAPFIQTNVVGTQVLLDAAKNYSKRFHHVSTDEVYGTLNLGENTKFTEDTPYDPHSPYAASKAASDHLVRAYHDTYDLPITISNCTNNYGPWHFPEKMIPLFITNLQEGKPIPVYGDGRHIRDWLYVEDHCTAIEAIILKGAIGETYCIGGGSEENNLDVARQLIILLDKDESLITFVKVRPGHDVRYAMDYSKIEQELGWAPSVTFQEGLKRTVEWFKDHVEWVAECKSGSYADYYKTQYGA